MTVILGVARGGQVCIGADSIAYTPEEMSASVRREPKVFHIGPDIVVGVGGSFRVMDALRYMDPPPPAEPGEEPHRYLVQVVVPSMREAVAVAGIVEEDEFFEAVIGYAGDVWLLENNWQCGSSADGIDGSGVGGDIAIGAALALALDDSPKSAEEMVLAAMDVAAERCAGVRGPFLTITTTR